MHGCINSLHLTKINVNLSFNIIISIFYNQIYMRSDQGLLYHRTCKPDFCDVGLRLNPI